MLTHKATLRCMQYFYSPSSYDAFANGPSLDSAFIVTLNLPYLLLVLPWPGVWL
jgi:hypothetical protein